MGDEACCGNAQAALKLHQVLFDDGWEEERYRVYGDVWMLLEHANMH